MPDTTLDGAAFKAEVLRIRTEEKKFPGSEGPIGTSISSGVASYTAGAPETLVHAADRALYQAKRSGRNSIMVSRTREVNA